MSNQLSENSELSYQTYLITMRSKTTGGEDIQRIRVWSGQDPVDVARNAAQSYGATVEAIEPSSE